MTEKQKVYAKKQRLVQCEHIACSVGFVCAIIRSAVNSRELFRFYIKKFGFKKLGLTLEFRSLVGIGRSGGMIGRCCLNMVPKFQHGSEL